MGGSGRAGRGQQVVADRYDDLYREDPFEEFSGDVLDLTGELAILGPADSERRHPWLSRANLVTKVLVLSAVVGLVAGGVALLIRAFVGDNLGTNASSTVAAYLRDVQSANYPAAYGRLCRGPDTESLDAFTARLSDARTRGHAIASFRIRVSFSKDTLSLNSTTGNVTYTDGVTESVSYDLKSLGGSAHAKCVVGYQDLS